MSERFSFSDDAQTFRDALTGLTWQAAVSPSRHTWNEANAYAAGLDLSGGGWRLPEVDELLTLVDRSTYYPATWPALRGCTPSDWYWSVAPYAPSSGHAWVVGFSNGSADSDCTRHTRRVRCVR